MSSERTVQMGYQQKQIDRLLWRCCVNCEYFQEVSSYNQDSILETQMKCTFYTPHQQPPVEVIVVGCEQHVDHIPF